MSKKLHPQTLAIRSGKEQTEYYEHNQALFLTSSFMWENAQHAADLFSKKIKGLKKGDKVAFYGEYEWSEQGGVIHWTHHDPAGRHEDGWLKHGGQIYQ